MNNSIKKWFNKLSSLFQGKMGKLKKEREQLDQAVSRMDDEGGTTHSIHRRVNHKSHKAS